MTSPFDRLNALGLLAFAVVDALDGIDDALDLLGVVVVGVVVAFGLRVPPMRHDWHLPMVG